jgi:hypothetical protein
VWMAGGIGACWFWDCLSTVRHSGRFVGRERVRRPSVRFPDLGRPEGGRARHQQDYGASDRRHAGPLHRGCHAMERLLMPGTFYEKQVACQDPSEGLLKGPGRLQFACSGAEAR